MPVEHYVSVEEVRHALRSLYGSDPETNLQAVLSRALADPLKPIDEKVAGNQVHSSFSCSSSPALWPGYFSISAWEAAQMSPYYDQPGWQDGRREDLAGVLVLLACAVLAVCLVRCRLPASSP